MTDRRGSLFSSSKKSDKLTRTLSTNINDYDLHSLLEKNDTKEIKNLFDSIREKRMNVDPRTLAKWLSETDAEGQAPIHKAMKSRDPLVIKAFLDFYLKEKLDINVQEKFGYTPLHSLVSNTDASAESIRFLLTEFPELKINCINRDKNTPLHYFAKNFANPHTCVELAELFVTKGSNVNASNLQGETPLHKAIFNSSVRLLLVEFLLTKGANVNCQNEKGETCLHYAVRLGRKDLITLLLVAGANVSLKGSENKTAQQLAEEGNNKTLSRHLRKVQDLIEWANKEKIEKEYVSLFVKEEIFLDVLADVDDATLEGIGITKAGPRVKILSACKRIQAMEKSSSGSSSLSHSTSVSINPFGGDELDMGETAQMDPELLKKGLFSRMQNEKRPAIQDLIIHKDQLEFTKRLGEGKSGRVFKGLYKGRDVAIKVLKSNEDIEEFKKEFLIISSVISPHIVHFYGACLEPQIAMVMDFCSRGSLYDVMMDSKIAFTWDMFFKMALQTAQAIDTLHNWEPQIVHRDLKSMNLLVKENFDVVLADFGLSRFATESNAETLMKVCGTVAYCAPEIFFGGSYNAKCDSYSIAVVLWELVVRVLVGEYQRPYSEYPNLKFDFQIITHVSDQKYRPTFPPTCPKGISQLITEAWSPNQEDRPQVSKMIKDLEGQQEEYQKHKSEWDSVIQKRS